MMRLLWVAVNRETRKGTILGVNPLTIDPKTIKDIPVLETISHGKTIYKR